MEQQEIDTFDDGPYTDGPMDDTMSQEETLNMDDEGTTFAEVEGEEGQDSEEASVQAEESEKIDEDSQVNLLDEKEESGGEKGEKEAEKKADSGDEEDKDGDESPESDESPKDDAGEDAGTPSEDVRTIKAFQDGKKYEIPEDAEIKVKVAGKNEKVTLQDLRDNYSGKQAWDQKFTDLSERDKTVTERETVVNNEVEVVKDHFTNIRQLTESGMKGEVDPKSSMNYILDLMGINTVNYNKAMFEHMAEEFDAYSDLTESEREAHWTKQENAYLVKKQESLTKRQSDQQSQAEHDQKVSQLREAHSISEEDYVSAEEDLKASGMENITPVQIAQAAKLKPLLSQADDLIDPYLEQLTEDEAYELSVDIATTMLKSPNMSVDQVKQVLAEQFEVEDIVSEIEDKVGKRKQSKVHSAPKTDELEMFED